MPKCTLKFARIDDGCCIRIEGWGTMRQSRTAKDVAMATLGEGAASRVIFDLNACTYLDSTFLGCLMDLHRAYGRSSPPRFFIAAPEDVRIKLLKACRLDRLLLSMDVVPTPCGDFVEIPERVFDKQDLMTHVMECHQRLAETDSQTRDFFLKIASQLQKELAANPRRF